MREALVAALLPPGARSPGFWARFDRLAPPHLRWGLAFAAWVLVRLWPLLHGRGRLDRLDPDTRERLLQRAAGAPLTRDLVMVAKIVSCFAVFDEEP